MKLKNLFLLVLILLTNGLSAKVYFDDQGNKLFDGKDFPVLDLVICLDKYKFDGKEWTYYEKGRDLDLAPILGSLINAIEQEEALIACSNLIRELVDKAKKKSDNGIRSKNAITTINDPKKWLKLTTNDQEFVILIPHKKYSIQDITELDSIGLNQNEVQLLSALDDNFYKQSELAQQKRLDNLAKTTTELKTTGLIPHETLLNLFLKTGSAKNIMKPTTA